MLGSICNLSYLIVHMCLSVSCMRAQSCQTLWPHGLQPARLLCPWDSPDKNTGGSSHFLLQEIFPTQGWNPHLLHGQAGSWPLSHLGIPSLISDAHNNQLPWPHPRQTKSATLDPGVGSSSATQMIPMCHHGIWLLPEVVEPASLLSAYETSWVIYISLKHSGNFSHLENGEDRLGLWFPTWVLCPSASTEEVMRSWSYCGYCKMSSRDGTLSCVKAYLHMLIKMLLLELHLLGVLILLAKYGVSGRGENLVCE